MGLLFVQYLDNFTTGFKRDNLHISLLLAEEEALLAGNAALVGHFALQIADIDAGDFVFRKHRSHRIPYVMGIVFFLLLINVTI